MSLDQEIVKAVAIETNARIQEGLKLFFVLAPASPLFDEIRRFGTGYPRSNLVLTTVAEIEKTVNDLSNVFMLDKFKYKFPTGIDQIIPECTGSIRVLWKNKFEIQERILKKGYSYKQAEEISSLDLLLIPFQDSDQRYWVDVDLDRSSIVIQDRLLNNRFDPRALFDRGSSQYISSLSEIAYIDFHQLINDIGGIDRATAVHFCRMSIVDGRYDLHYAKRVIKMLT